MTAADDRCAKYRVFQAIDTAFRRGDLAALRAAVEDPEIIPDVTPFRRSSGGASSPLRAASSATGRVSRPSTISLESMPGRSSEARVRPTCPSSSRRSSSS